MYSSTRRIVDERGSSPLRRFLTKFGSRMASLPNVVGAISASCKKRSTFRSRSIMPAECRFYPMLSIGFILFAAPARAWDMS